MITPHYAIIDYYAFDIDSAIIFDFDMPLRLRYAAAACR